MTRIFRRKLLAPSFPEALPRPRLLTLAGTARLLLVQAPSGAGKTVFLAQWLAGRGRSGVWYSLDAGDRDPAVFCAHLVDGFRRLDSEWNPPPEALADAGELAVELVSQGFEADLVLDGAEAVFGQPWLADFLAVVARYAPPGFALAMAGRAPLPVSGVTVTAADLAFTADEVPSLAGEMPVVASVSRAELGARLRAGMPPHIAPERGRTLVDSYLSGQLGLAEFGHQVSCAPPGAEQLWSELGQARHLFLLGEFRAAQALLSATWDSARGRGNPALVGATALLMGDTYYGLGEYDQALEWYRQGFEADPALETTGNCAKAFILRDQGFLAEAEALARRCVEACTGRGDLQALSFAKLQYGWMCAWAGRFDEAEREAEEAQRIGQQCPEPLYGLIALLHRAGIAGMEQNQTVYRRLAEEGYTLARGRSPWLEALAGYILAGALLRWGDREQAGRLVARSFEILTRIECKYQIHMLLSITAQAAWVDGRVQEARAQFDRALTLAAAQGYTYILAGEGYQLRPLLIDAMVRGVEVAFCQRVLVQQGVKALPGLLELTQAPDAGARRAALYPLSAIGGEEATAAVRRLMHDEDERVRDSALLAMKSLGFPSVPATAAPVAPVAAAGVSVSVLGPLVVAVDGKPVSGWRTTKARDLLAFLALGGDRPYTRDQLGEALWPDGDPEAVTRLLHTSLHHLRRALGPEGESLITFAGGAYRLDRAKLELDLDRFMSLVTVSSPEGWRTAVSLWRGELLEGLDYGWCDGPRSRIRAAYQELLRRLARHMSDSGRWTEAAEFLQLLIESDPLVEDGHVGLMECYAALGNRAAALQQYRTLARVLDEELGVEPGARAQELYRQLID